jgi:hypothetical protein
MSEPFVPPHVTQDSICVLYAPDSGEIVFVHRVTTLGDVPTLSANEIEIDARASMQQLGDRLPENLGALIVTPDTFRPGRSYLVDSITATLIERSNEENPSGSYP